MEREYVSSTDTQFDVQIYTEVRVQNLDKFAPRSDFEATVKKDKDKEKWKRETFIEFMVKNSHLYSEQEDQPHQSFPPVEQGTGG